MAEARKKQRLFVDIDGTLAVFKPVDTLETLYEKGYFLNLAPHENVVAAVKEIVTNHPEIEVNILSAYLTDSQYALQEKNEWLDRYLPEIDQTHRIFVPCGSDKKEGIGGIRSDDFLLDDYTHNLNEWQPPARGIKLLNAINHTRGSWEHDRIRYDRTPTDLADGIISIMRDERRIFDEKINERERKENMAQERVTGVKPAPTELAGKIVNFLENYDPAFGYAEGMAGQENKEQWIDTITERLLQERTDSYIAYLRELAEQTPEAKEEADAIILEIMDYEGKLPSLNQFPVSEVSTLDFVNNPDRQGTGGLNRDSRMFEAMLLHTREQEQTELYRRYDEAFTAANLKDDFQPKIAILQLREGEENHNRRFISLETLDRIMHEQPNCENYELVYLRNAEVKAGTEQERERLNNQLYAEFNADTLRPRDYYGHSLSVGDVIVITNDFSEQHAYYVDDMGFTKLPDNFLSHEMSAKIRNDLDIRQEEMLYENIGKFEAESTMSIMDKTAADRYFQITSGYSRIFELADRRGAIMDMDDLGYEPAQIDGFSDDFLMWKTKDEVDTDNSFGFDGWEAVRDFTNNVHTLINNYTVQELQDRANGNYSIIEYGTFDDREVQTAIKNYPQQERAGLDEYRQQVSAIYEYEVANNIPENDRMTKWYDEMNIAVAKPWYKENDPSVMDRATGERRVPISEASIAARYAEISREQQERNSSFAADEPLVDISNMEYDEDVLSTGAASMTLDEFKQMSRADFERFVGEVNAYNMVEQERVPSPEREQELNHGEDTRNPFNETNFKIQPVENGGFVVRSDSERFGNNEIVFQGISYDECLNYIAERTDNITPHYYVIKDLASWRSDVWEQGQAPERSAVERFDTVEEAIAKFNEYKGMDYLKENIINPDNNEPMRRLALGVSYNPVQMAEMDLLHTEADKTLLLSDTIGERENGYESFMTNSKFIQDLNKITSSIAIDEYSYYRDSTIEELAADRLAFLNENYPEETHTREEAMRVAEEYVRRHPNYLRSNRVNERVAFADFTPPFLNKGESELNHGEYENITLHIKYQEPINFNGFVVENDTITFGSQEELSKYVNGEAAYDVLDNSVMKRDNEILLYAENENGDVVWGTKEEQRETESMTYGGFDYTVIDKWQDDNASYVVGQLEADDGTWYAAKVTDTTEQYRGEYEYEFSTDKPTRSDVEDMHLNHISEIAIDRHEAEYGADGSRNFPNLNDPSPEEQAEELRQIVAEKSAPVEIDETLPPKDQLKQRLENGVRQVLDSEQFKNWLTTGGKLFYNNYSFRNAMLVWLQKPEASYVMGYEKWKDFGRNVKQGAQGAKIFIPLMASEKYKGGLFRSIKSNLTDQLSKDPSLTEASYRLGTSNLEFTMNRANHLIGFKVNGKEQQIFGSDDEAKRFIDRAIIGKVPTGFTVGTVFDAKDVIVPEYLWVKSGYTKEEIAPDEKGNPVKNRRGEVRIFNTPERQARFQTELDTRIVAKDPVKMQALFDACVAASERKGVPVSLAEKADDSTLDGGAKGYFSRQFTEDKPNGFIVIDNSLEITEKCAVLFHEMGHADLHKNLEALAKSMGEDKITREMREVQAEATAYAVASTFGIETDTSSFQYLAAYARGFELQDFQKSLDVIYRETQALTNDIKAELDIRGLNLDLTEKPKEMLNKETLETLSTKYMDFAAEQGSKVQAALNELPSLVKQSAGNPELMDVLKYQKANLDSRKADLDTMLTAIENLNTADTREKQDEIISTLDAAMNRVNGDAYAFENLSENYVVITERARGGLKVDFEQNPQKTLEAMKKDYPALAKLSEPQLQYLATSKFVAREFTKLLRDNPQEFVDKACERAALISKAASKNGTFVEVNFCEQWTDKPFFEKGTLCSPKIADKTVTGCEAQARGFSAEAEKRGDYFPYTKCDMTIFTPNKDGKLISLNTRVDIGDGAQTSLKDHLEQLCKRGSERKEVLANFTEALTERADKRKLLVQDLSAKPQSAEQPEMTTEKEGNMSREEWDGQIKDAREKAAQEQREKAAEKAQNKSNRDRAE